MLRDDILSAYLDGELDAEQRAMVEQHLDSNKGAATRLERMRSSDSLLRQAFPATAQVKDNRLAAMILEPKARVGARVWATRLAPIAAAIVFGVLLGQLPRLGAENTAPFAVSAQESRLLDTMPSGGFGNLIALPLQRHARELGNSMFVDDDLRPHEDQWAFLGNQRRLSSADVATLIGRAEADMPGGATGVRLPVDDENADEPWKMTGSSLPEHETFFFYLQRICNHCTYPGCLAACPRKAIYKRPEDGIVLIDQNRCRGYKKCVEQCPYKKPMYRGTTRVSEKCIACYPRIEGKDPLTGGEPMETRCMAACVGKIRMQSLMRIGDDGLWAEDRWHPLYYAIRVEQVALPLYPQWGTEPNGYYIPPRHSPRGYARQMFGPGVDNAIEKYLVPSRELLAVLQLWRASQQIIFRYDVIPGPKVFETQIHGKRFEMYNDTVLGFNKSGKEVARIQVEEPIYIRPAERVTWL